MSGKTRREAALENKVAELELKLADAEDAAADGKAMVSRVGVLLEVYWAAAALKSAEGDYCNAAGQIRLEKAVNAARKVLDKKSSKKGKGNAR